jgi:hypothetical protein
MRKVTINLSDRERLIRIGDALIPAGQAFPQFGNVRDIHALLERAASACGYAPEVIEGALQALGEIKGLGDARRFHDYRPEHFAVLSLIVSGAYYMSPDVLALMDYPVERRHPAGMEEFLEEYETGIVDPVVNRGPQYVDPKSGS